MKIKSNLHAGMTFEECDAQRNYWKSMVQSGKCNAYYPTYPTYPTHPTYPSYPSYPTYPPTSSGGGYVNGVYYADLSGACG